MVLSIFNLDIQVLLDSEHQECKIHRQIPAWNRYCGDRTSRQYSCYLLYRIRLFRLMALNILSLGIQVLLDSDHQECKIHCQILAWNRYCGDRTSLQYSCYLLYRIRLFRLMALNILSLDIQVLLDSAH